MAQRHSDSSLEEKLLEYRFHSELRLDARGNPASGLPMVRGSLPAGSNAAFQPDIPAPPAPSPEAQEPRAIVLSTQSPAALKMGTQQLIPRSLAVSSKAKTPARHQSFGAAVLSKEAARRDPRLLSAPSFSLDDMDVDMVPGGMLRRNLRNQSYRAAMKGLGTPGGEGDTVQLTPKLQALAEEPSQPARCAAKNKKTLGRKRAHKGSFKDGGGVGHPGQATSRGTQEAGGHLRDPHVRVLVPAQPWYPGGRVPAVQRAAGHHDPDGAPPPLFQHHGRPGRQPEVLRGPGAAAQGAGVCGGHQRHPGGARGEALPPLRRLLLQRGLPAARPAEADKQQRRLPRGPEGDRAAAGVRGSAHDLLPDPADAAGHAAAPPDGHTLPEDPGPPREVQGRQPCTQGHQQAGEAVQRGGPQDGAHGADVHAAYTAGLQQSQDWPILDGPGPAPMVTQDSCALHATVPRATGPLQGAPPRGGPAGSTLSLPLISASRWLLKRGELFMVEETGLFRKLASRPTCYLFLFNDVLVVTKKKSEDSFVVQDYAQVDHIQVQKMEPSELSLPGGGNRCSSVPHPFQLTLLHNSEGRQERLLLSSDSASDRARWVTALTHKERQERGPTNKGDLLQVEITKAYLAKQVDEITLQQADVVLVLEHEDGWFYGERLRDGETGWFPEDFARSITSREAVEDNVRRMERLRVETDV
nr:rho guanine nucleotide exchange factor 16 isoform X2 [Vicugna pacos]